MTVHISGFSSQHTANIEAAFNNWSNNSGDADVTFAFSAVPVTEENTYTVTREVTSSGDPGETGGGTVDGHRHSAFTRLHPNITNGTALSQTAAHEIGHTFGLDECYGCPAGSSVMNGTPAINGQIQYNDTTWGRTGPANCDIATVNTNPQYPNNPPPGDEDPAGCQNGEGYVDDEGCGSPILLSEQGNRLQLTDVSGGVEFDLDGDGLAERLAWTVAGSDDSFLFLDRNSNGVVDDGTELFGNYTPQPASSHANGFLALAVYDQQESGGNDDGWISVADAIYPLLVLWNYRNHDGLSQPGELRPISSLGIAAIDLLYRESRRRDQYGNEFRYFSRVILDRRTQATRKLAVDVFLRMRR